MPKKIIPLLLLVLLISCKKEKDDPVIPTSGMVAYFPFDENTNDLSNNENDGIDFTEGSFVSGVKSNALNFNGTTDFIKLTNSINSENGLSVSFWIKTRGANGEQNSGSVLSKYNMSKNKRSFMISSFGAYENRNDNRLSAVFFRDGNTYIYSDLVRSYMEPGEFGDDSNHDLWIISDARILVLNKWTHCVVNVTDTTIETWINGNLCVKKIREFDSYFSSGDEPIYIGNNISSGEGSNNHFNGVLDELRIYNRGLTIEEIEILYNY